MMFTFLQVTFIPLYLILSFFLLTLLFNDLFRKKTSLDFNNFVNENKVFIITNGDKGSDIFTQKENFHIE